METIIIKVGMVISTPTNAINLGMKTITPNMAAEIAEINTAPAAASLAFPAKGWNSGWARSVRYSIAVLKASAERTMPIDKINKHHSVVDILKIKPPAITQAAMIR